MIDHVKLLVPPALEPLAVTEMPLLAHAQPAHQRGGGEIAGVEPTDDTVHADPIERDVEQCYRGLEVVAAEATQQQARGLDRRLEREHRSIVAEGPT
jgi:hypothetical protein